MSRSVFLKLFKKLLAFVLSDLKHSAMPHVLNPIKHCCSLHKLLTSNIMGVLLNH